MMFWGDRAMSTRETILFLLCAAVVLAVVLAVGGTVLAVFAQIIFGGA